MKETEMNRLLRNLLLVSLCFLTQPVLAARPAAGLGAPAADHHQHLFGPAIAALAAGSDIRDVAP
jgi:hypothetical protein